MEIRQMGNRVLIYYDIVWYMWIYIYVYMQKQKNKYNEKTISSMPFLYNNSSLKLNFQNVY